MRILTAFRLLLIGLWLGAAIFFIGVAQTAFNVLPSREVAGNFVSQTLAILNYSGIGVAVIAFLTSLIGTTIAGRGSLIAERILLIALGLACVIGQFVISWWMLLVRTQMGRPIDEVPVDDPLRIQFNNLHQYSSWVMLIAMAAALLAFIIISTRSTTPQRKGFDNFDFEKELKI